MMHGQRNVKLLDSEIVQCSTSVVICVAAWYTSRGILSRSKQDCRQKT